VTSARCLRRNRGQRNGCITVASNASNSLTVSLSGTGTAQGQLTLAPTALNFGSATVGTNVSQTSSLSAGGASVTVASASLSSAEFSLTGVSFPVTIAAGQSTPVTVTFSPQSSGSALPPFRSPAMPRMLRADSERVGVAPTQHSVFSSWTDTNSGIAGYNIYRGSVSGGPTPRSIRRWIRPHVQRHLGCIRQTYYYVPRQSMEAEWKVRIPTKRKV